MSLQPLDPQNINDFTIINDYVSFKWIKIDVTLFWLLCLAILTTKQFENEIVDQLSYDTNWFQLHAPNGIALSLIAQVNTSFITICGKSINKKLYK